MRGSTAPGRCADCGSDAYIQLAVEDAMLCAHCYADRLGLKAKSKPAPMAKPQMRRQAT